jgi:hypothetical protein
MLRFLKKRESKIRDNADQPAIIKNAMEKLIAVQHRIADRLNERAALWQPERIKLALILFCLLFGITSLTIMAKAIWRPNPDNSVTVKYVKMPEHIGHTANGITIPDHFISRKEYNRLEHFRVYMDNLDSSADGKKIKDSILSQRPKLLDSLVMVEQLYNKQK